MQQSRMKFSVSALALIVGMAAANKAAEAAQTQIYVGGGTAPAKIYRQIFNCYAIPLFGSTAPNTVEGATTPFPSSLQAGACSTTGSTTTNPYKAPFNATSASEEFFFTPVGSGDALKGYTSESAVNFSTPATSNSVAFTTTAYAAYPYPAIDFASSDAALTTTQVSDIGPSNGLAAIQLPAFAGPIAVPFNPGTGFTYPSNFAIPHGGSSKLKLSPASVCGIFTGAITNWDNAQLTTDNGGVALTSNKPINVYVRLDSSGSSAIFSEWLELNCANTPYPVAANFDPGTTPTWPAGFTKVSGSGGIANAVENTAYAIGYVSPDYVQPVVATGAPAAANIVDPNGEEEPPAAGRTQNLVNTLTPPAATAGPYAWGQPINDALAEKSTTAKGYPANAYPIVGFTFLDFYQCYAANSPHNPGVSGELSYFLQDFLLVGSGNARNEVNLLLNSNGYAQPTGAFLQNERTIAATISYTGTLSAVKGSAACNATGVTGVAG